MFYFLGGVAIFLYGVHQMSRSMEALLRLSDGGFRRVLLRLTRGRIWTILLGCGITGAVQSSTAVTVMVVGMAEAGALPLRQALDLIMGANVGTTATAWLVSLRQLPQLPWLMPALAAGGFVCMALPRFPWKGPAALVMGVGLVFLGLDWMNAGLAAGEGAGRIFHWVLEVGAHPLGGLLAGMALACVIQSSSAGIGILQVMALEGQVGLAAGAYLILGENIGTCLTTLAAGAGLGTEARAASRFHLIFNLAGAVVLCPLCALVFAGQPQWAALPVSPAGLALFHSASNVVSVVGLYPFVPRLARRLQPETECRG